MASVQIGGNAELLCVLSVSSMTDGPLHFIYCFTRRVDRMTRSSQPLACCPPSGLVNRTHEVGLEVRSRYVDSRFSVLSLSDKHDKRKAKAEVVSPDEGPRPFAVTPQAIYERVTVNQDAHSVNAGSER